MSKNMFEILTEINNDPKLLEKHKQNRNLKFILQYAFDPQMKFVLPKSTPPYKKSPGPTIELSESNLSFEARKLYIFAKKELPKTKREIMFIQLLEALHTTEVDILLHVKNQTLDKRFPNITKELVQDIVWTNISE
jgi:hypothetical protein